MINVRTDPRFKGFIVPEDDHELGKIIFKKYTFFGVDSEDAPSAETQVAIERWLPDFKANIVTEALQVANLVVETPLGDNWHSKMRRVIPALRFEPQGDILVNTTDLSGFIFPQSDSDAWFISHWKLVKHTRASLKQDYGVNAEFDPDEDLENDDEIICDEVTWSHQALDDKEFNVLFGWVAYR